MRRHTPMPPTRQAARCAALALLLAACVQAAEPDYTSYQPDFRTWDVYLPHLNRTYLCGWWKLKLLKETEGNPADDAGMKNAYYAPGFNDAGWETVMVPHAWQVPFPMIKTYWKIRKSTEPHKGLGWYRLTFKAPANPNRLRAVLHFEEVNKIATVYVNGRKVGEHTDYKIDSRKSFKEDFELDVTDSLRFGGANVLAVRVWDDAKTKRRGAGAEGGIAGAVYLDLRPAVWCDCILVTPDEDLQGLRYDCRLGGSSAERGAPANWRVEVFDWDSGKAAAKARAGRMVRQDGEDWLTGKIAVPNANAWSCESPFLYGIRFLDAQGETAGVRRFGMRTFHARNGQFVLNGKPTCLRGRTIHVGEKYWRYGPFFAHNEGHALFRHFKRLRDANVNHIRFHTSSLRPIGYDILDQLGFLVTDELKYPTIPIPLEQRTEDKIMWNTIDSSCEKDGTLRPAFRRRITHRVQRRYSHPCIATFSFGNEMREGGQMRAMFNHLYDLYTELDRQDRPITPASGRYFKSARDLTHREDKLDYIDTHDYSGTTARSAPLSRCDAFIEQFVAAAGKLWPEGIPPIVNGETVYMAHHYYPQFYDPIWKAEHDAEPNWEKYIWALEEMRKEFPAHEKLSHYWVREWGSKGYKYRREAGRGYYLERVLEIWRRRWPEADGYEFLSSPIYEEGPTFPLQDSTFEPNDAYEPLKQVCAPVVVVLDYVAPNRYAGEPIDTTATVINNSERDIPKVTLQLALMDGTSQIAAAKQEAGALHVGEKKQVACSLRVPEWLDDKALVLAYGLADGTQTLCLRERDINVRKRATVFQPIATHKRILFYGSAPRVFRGQKMPSSRPLLDAFKLPYKPVDSLDRLDCDLLIVGANGLDARLRDAADTIRAFVEQGGRVLILEQTLYQEHVPFLPGLVYQKAGVGHFAEIVQASHPTVNGMRQTEFNFWHQNDWGMYHAFIRPLSEAAVLVGGDDSGSACAFGMVVAHVKLGKGAILFCQADVSTTFNSDSAAGLLAARLIQTALSEVGVSRARTPRLRDLKVAPLSRQLALYVPLAAAANMGFADETAGDGKGGWTDQGPENDLHAIPLGERELGGVPFRILDPSRNGGKSCVVVSAHPKLSFRPESAPIPVGAKLRRLVFLHTSAWTQEGVVGRYRVRYASGRTAEIPIETGTHIADWWGAPSKRVSQAQCVWSESNGSTTVGAFAFSWQNPQPDDPIQSVRLKSEGKTVIGLLALTGESVTRN
ncbi:MAG: hypothetical protein JXR37_21585 [Kiritimatiellae bacterium]|nr:hypothetical protein [Kiritimatiellia bacterium]